MSRRERPGLLLDRTWHTPLGLFTSVVGADGSSWLQSQPIRQQQHSHSGSDNAFLNTSSGGGDCATDIDCELNGVCTDAKCDCDPQVWMDTVPIKPFA